MPIGALAAAGITAGSQLLSQGFNVGAIGNQNRKNRAFTREMYDRQIADNLRFWNMQNAYNSPVSQMQRFKDAGLNPNLIYDRGSSGDAGSMSAPAAHWVGQAPHVQFPDVMSRFYDFQAKSAQIDNLKDTSQVLKADAALKNAQAIASLVGGERGRFDLDLRKDARASLLKDIEASASLHSSQAVGQTFSNQLMVQKYEQLEKTNPLEFQNMKKALELLGYQTIKTRKESQLVGVDGRSGIGSVLRLLFSVFGISPDSVGSSIKSKFKGFNPF